MDSTEAYVFFFPLMLSCFQGCSCSILYREHHGLCPVFTILFIHQTLWLPHFKLKLKKIYLNVSVTTQRRHKTGIQDHFRLIDSFMFKSVFFLCDKSPRRETGAASLSLSPGLSQCSAHKSSWMSAHLALCKRMRLCQQPAEKHHSGCSGLCSYSFSHL